MWSLACFASYHQKVRSNFRFRCKWVDLAFSWDVLSRLLCDVFFVPLARRVRDMGWEMIGEKTGIHKSFTINSSHATGLELLEPPRSSSTKLLFCPNLLLIIFKPHTVSPRSKKIKLCILDKINKSEAICNSMSQIHLGPARDEQVYFGCKNIDLALGVFCIDAMH